MPTLRKDIVNELLEELGVSKAKLAQWLGFNSRVAFYNHFKKKDIGAELYKEILKKLTEKGFTKDAAIVGGNIKQTTGDITGNRGDMVLSNINGEGLHAEEHHHYPAAPPEGLKEALVLAKEQIALYKRLWEESLVKIEQLETKLKHKK